MMWFEYLRVAQKALRAHKFRSLLTVLSITIGAFSIVLMSSLAESGLATLSKGVEGRGSRALALGRPGALSRGRPARRPGPLGHQLRLRLARRGGAPLRDLRRRGPAHARVRGDPRQDRRPAPQRGGEANHQRPARRA